MIRKAQWPLFCTISSKAVDFEAKHGKLTKADHTVCDCSP